MKLRNILTVLGVAAVTAAATLGVAALWDGGIVEAGPAIMPIISQPKLTSQGCTFVLTTDKASYEAAESPVIEVTASNPTDKAVNATVWVVITGTSPTGRMSRIMQLPITVWSQEYAFNLAPDETKSKSVMCQVPFAAGQNVQIIMSDNKNNVLAYGVGVPPNGSGQQQNVGGPNRRAAPANGGPNGR